jgi:hypothetical protein
MNARRSFLLAVLGCYALPIDAASACFRLRRLLRRSGNRTGVPNRDELRSANALLILRPTDCSTAFEFCQTEIDVLRDILCGGYTLRPSTSQSAWPFSYPDRA